MNAYTGCHVSLFAAVSHFRLHFPAALAAYEHGHRGRRLSALPNTFPVHTNCTRV